MIETNREPPFYLGVVEDRSDPLKIGRVRVRVIGLHTHDKVALPTEDLPWCYCIQPVSSAAMSGIGQSPVGPVEGTWVAVQFMDVDKQNPFVVGTLPGISQSQSFFNNSPNQGGNYEVKKDGTVVAPWTDYGDQPIGDGKFNMPGGYTTSKSMIDKIKSIEKFEANPYKDVKGVWTIGYGTTYIDGVPVSQTTPEITEAKASELFTRDLALFEAAVKAVVLVPVTQSMFDAMVSLTYNIGAGAFRKSTLVKEINSKNYAAAAEKFMEWIYSGGKIITGLQTRRQSEKTWFLREGTGVSDTGAVQTASMSIRSARMIGGTSNSASTSVSSTANNNPLSKILDFNSAGSFVLPDDEKQKLISSGGVKILSKEEYWSVNTADPVRITYTSGVITQTPAPTPTPVPAPTPTPVPAPTPEGGGGSFAGIGPPMSLIDQLASYAANLVHYNGVSQTGLDNVTLFLVTANNPQGVATDLAELINQVNASGTPIPESVMANLLAIAEARPDISNSVVSQLAPAPEPLPTPAPTPSPAP